MGRRSRQRWRSSNYPDDTVPDIRGNSRGQSFSTTTETSLQLLFLAPAVVVSIFSDATVEERRMVAGKVVNLCTQQCGRGVTLRDNMRQGVTPCSSLAKLAKGDLCGRPHCPSRLPVCRFVFQSFSPSNKKGPRDEVFLMIVAAQSAASTGGVENLQQITPFFRDMLAQGRALIEDSESSVLRREKKRVLRHHVSGIDNSSHFFFHTVHFASRVFWVPCHYRRDSGVRLSSFQLGHS